MRAKRGGTGSSTGNKPLGFLTAVWELVTLRNINFVRNLQGSDRTMQRNQPQKPHRPQRLLNDAAFFTAACLLDGVLSHPRIHSEVASILGYDGRDGLFNMHSAMRQMAAQGIVRDCGVMAGERMFQLTKLGYQLFRETYDFREKSVDYLKWAVEREYPLNRFADGPSAREEAQRRVERNADPEEYKKIMANATPAFRLLYDFFMETRLRMTDCLHTPVSGFDGANKVLRLPEKTLSGRRIKDRNVHLSDLAVEMVRTAIGDREEGMIFLTETGKPWNQTYASAVFRKLREDAGIEDDVVMKAQGRKGRTGPILKGAKRRAERNGDAMRDK
jgi:Phage integrase family